MAFVMLASCVLLASFFGLAWLLGVDIDGVHPVNRYRLNARIASQFEESHAPIAELTAAILLAQTGAEIAEIDPHASLMATFNVYDGFDTVRFLEAVESAFEVRISNSEADAMCTLGQLVDFLYVRMHDV